MTSCFNSHSTRSLAKGVVEPLGVCAEKIFVSAHCHHVDVDVRVMSCVDKSSQLRVFESQWFLEPVLWSQIFPVGFWNPTPAVRFPGCTWWVAVFIPSSPFIFFRSRCAFFVIHPLFVSWIFVLVSSVCLEIRQNSIFGFPCEFTKISTKHIWAKV